MRSLPSRRDRSRKLTWKSGSFAWAGIAAYVVVWDLIVVPRWGAETLTSGFHRGRRHPHARVAVLGAWGVTTLHLLGALPPGWDPYLVAGRVVRAVRGVTQE
jgi:hypothetical protein